MNTHLTSLQPAESENALNPVFIGVEQAIHEHRLPPGVRLAEGELAEIYGVSRTIVRAGLQALSHSRLVTIRPNRGACVAKPTPDEAREVFEARELLEPRTAFEAAKRARPEDIALLQAHCRSEHAAVDARQHGLALRLSGAFHIEIARIAGQRTLLAFIDGLVARSALVIALYWRKESARCEGHSHNALIDALSRGDGHDAESLMRSHLVDIYSALDFGSPEAEDLSLSDMLKR
jgi:DNA-binding GntR family transcriptional regulator